MILPKSSIFLHFSSEMSIVSLVSSDGKVFDCTVTEISESKLLKNILTDIEIIASIPLRMISSEVLAVILMYIKTPQQIRTNEWKTAFIEENMGCIMEVLGGAQFLEISELEDLLTDFLVREIEKCKTTEELRAKFGIENDFTPEQEAAVKKQVEWAL